MLPGPGRFQLAGAEGRHAATVRRLRAGERLELVDGIGGRAVCQVTVTRRDELDLEVLAAERTPAPQPRMTVVQALPKGDRGELAVELMTEVGVDRVVPWAAQRCVTRWEGERGAKALRRWRSAAAAAAKQSRRTWWPQVTELASTGQVAELLARADFAVVLDEQAVAQVAQVTVPPVGELVVVVGPEGGIPAEECAVLDAPTLRLGSEVLRTSTAGVVAVAALMSRTPRWTGPHLRPGESA